MEPPLQTSGSKRQTHHERREESYSIQVYVHLRMISRQHQDQYIILLFWYWYNNDIVQIKMSCFSAALWRSDTLTAPENTVSLSPPPSLHHLSCLCSLLSFTVCSLQTEALLFRQKWTFFSPHAKGRGPTDSRTVGILTGRKWGGWSRSIRRSHVSLWTVAGLSDSKRQREIKQKSVTRLSTGDTG